MNIIHSDFWLPDDAFGSGQLNHFQLAKHRRAISGFVSIMTGKNIPVNFFVQGDSFTDGKTVVISADINRDNYDSIVGTALHEAAHILFTDFILLRNMFAHIPQDIFNLGEEKNIDQQKIHLYAKDIWNWIEDRYIDKQVFKAAPGYRGYYRAMYDKYWNSTVVAKMLQSSEYRDETLESYRARIVNLTNPQTDLGALNGLQEIWDIVNLNKIERLLTTEDRLDLTFDVCRIILENVGTQSKQNNKESNSDSDNPNNQSNSQGSGQVSDETRNDESQNQESNDSDGNNGCDINDVFGGMKNEADSVDDGSDVEKSKSSQKAKSSANNSDSNGLTNRELKKFQKALEQQLDFIDHTPDNKNTKGKVPISVDDLEKLDSVEKSNTELKPVGFDDDISKGVPHKIECVVVRKMTKEIMTSPMFPISSGGFGNEPTVYPNSERAVIDGLRLGTILGKKLKVRGESRTTKYTRQKTGRIDKRLISELGFGQESVFSHLHIDEFKDAFIHISIDASSSMEGKKFEQCLTSACAIAKAGSMIENLEVVISFRTTYGDLPYIVVAYDSRIEGIRKIRTMFPCVFACGCTPEGLCFEAILDLIPPTNQNQDSYFLNFSDGAPYFTCADFTYSGLSAYEHTRKQINTMKSNGVKVLSYYIGDAGSFTTNFQRMYGKDARNIDVTNITSVATTMNKRFLQK